MQSRALAAYVNYAVTSRLAGKSASAGVTRGEKEIKVASARCDISGGKKNNLCRRKIIFPFTESYDRSWYELSAGVSHRRETSAIVRASGIVLNSPR